MRLLFCVLALICWLVPSAQAGPTVTDDLGRRVSLPHPPRRVISLAPSVTEILYAVGAQDKLVGDTAYCDYPPAAKAKPHVGGVITPSAEKIVALRADLVIMADQTLPAAQADALAARWHTPVYVTAAASYAGVERNVRDLGALAGTPGATRACVNQMEAARRQVTRAVAGHPRPRVFVVVWENPLMTAGGTSFIGDLIRLAGGVNVAENAGTSYPAHSPERLVQERPDVILTGARGVTTRPATLPFLSRLSLPAIRTGHALAVPADWVNRPGPRLSLGLRAVARVLHPEVFTK